MVKRIVKRACFLCAKRVDDKLLCLTITKSQPTVILLSSLVLFNATDLEEAKRCYEINAKRRFCDQHYIDAANFMMSEMACLGIRIASYTDHSRDELVLYVNEKDIPLHLFDSIQATARKIDVSCFSFKNSKSTQRNCAARAGILSRTINCGVLLIENLDISVRKVRDFLNGCFYRYSVLRSAVNGAGPQQETVTAVPNRETFMVDEKPAGLLCGTSSTPEYTGGSDHLEKDESADYAEEELGETNSDLLESIVPVKGDRLLSLFRYCPECGTQISRKRRRIVPSETGTSPTVHYICDGCGGKRCWDPT
ncbi:hypothetical protein Y032_0055g2593 [Ancylostoma ceylanicum]|uniref:Uncharacterized protein n=1 Tax=Ancylostoma ceylanicum TaxID=53326 RepID=A0A016U6P9_9BILA|nr:hypothetical protein Y032_0055g2593 [Ancylostoma ceylanicum]